MKKKPDINAFLENGAADVADRAPVPEVTPPEPVENFGKNTSRSKSFSPAARSD